LIHREGRHKERVVVRALSEVSLRLEEGIGSERAVVKLTFGDRPMRKRHYWFVIENGATQLWWALASLQRRLR
jgi:hypothetical protein